MENIRLDRVVSVSSEIEGHLAENILNHDISPNKNWMCEKGAEKAVVVLALERSAILTSIHVGNAHSAFVEILVGKAVDNLNYEPLVPVSTFMNPYDSKTSNNPNKTRIFNESDFNQSTSSKAWDRVKVVCSQPFNKHVPFGLCFLKIQGIKEGKKADPKILGLKKEEDSIQIGSFFKKKKTSDEKAVAEQQREAEKVRSSPINTGGSTGKVKEKQVKQTFTKDDLKECYRRKEKGSDDAANSSSWKKSDLRPKREEKAEKAEKCVGNEEERDDDEEEMKRRSIKKKPFEKLMEDVVLVISGFKNPLRGNIRSLALQMGARYSADWETYSTHLVCAYDNTPKFNQVKGKGKIVRREWVERCHADRRRYPWRRFALDKLEMKKPESEEEIEAGEESEPEEQGSEQSTSSDSGVLKRQENAILDTPERSAEAIHIGKLEKFDREADKKMQKTKFPDTDIYDLPTDEDDEDEGSRVDTTAFPMPHLPDMFLSKKFFVDPNLKNKSLIEKYIIAYKGILIETFDDEVQFYVTNRGGNLVEMFRKKIPNLIVVKPSWIWEVNSKQKWIPTESHLVQ